MRHITDEKHIFDISNVNIADKSYSQLALLEFCPFISRYVAGLRLDDFGRVLLM